MSQRIPVNGILGVVVTVFLLGVPGGPFFGGGVVGYLNRANRVAGLKSGAIVGAVATVLVIGWFTVRNYFVWGGTGQFAFGGLLGVLGDSLVGVAILLTIYLVGLGMLGGVVGGYVARVNEQH